MRFLFKFVTRLFIFCVLLILLVLVLVLQTSPSVDQKGIITSQSALHAKASAKRVIHTLRTKKQAADMTLSVDEISSLTSLLDSVLPRMRSKVSLVEDIGVVELSYQLPIESLYLNVTTIINSSDDGLDLENVIIGDMKLPGKWLVDLTRWSFRQICWRTVG